MKGEKGFMDKVPKAGELAKPTSNQIHQCGISRLRCCCSTTLLQVGCSAARAVRCDAVRCIRMCSSTCACASCTSVASRRQLECAFLSGHLTARPWCTREEDEASEYGYTGMSKQSGRKL